ncbi:MAG: DUF2195 family protein [Gammaproteobacteria bacterium]|nr:DUF2195 family protein [Gammaproteobacteria bacterium]MDH5654107.1 DUF2195 family protein [Gammaproteobacteria bacterium]
MQLRIACTIVVVFLSGCSSLPLHTVQIQNGVRDCYSFEPRELVITDKQLILTTQTRLHKSTGYCGCKSALLSYRVRNKNGDDSGSGQILSREEKQQDFVIDRKPETGKPMKGYTLMIGCAPPL